MKFEIKEEVGAMNVADGNLILNEKKQKKSQCSHSNWHGGY